jgi:hypothetical protein
LLIEKSISAYQSGAANNKTVHEHIIRASMQNDVNGRQTAFSQTAIMNNPAANAIVDKTATFDYVPASAKWVDALNAGCQTTYGHDFGWWTLNKSNAAAVVVVWKYISPTELFFINAVWADVK